MHLNRLSNTLRDHLHFFIILPLLIIVMTWPTLAQVFQTDSFWLTQKNIDANMIIWDAWYFKQMISGLADFYYTDLLFHPNGVSLAFHNFSLPHMILFAGLQELMPLPNAYNLSFLLLTFITAAAGYTYLMYLFRDKWVALFGTAVFSMSAFVLYRAPNPNNSFIATIPLSLYFLHRGLLEGQLKLALTAGVLIGLTAFIGMYTLVCLLMMLLAYLLYFACRRWRERDFWLHVFIMLLVLGGFLALRFYPMVVDSQGLSSALAKHDGREAGNDVLLYFVNTKHPLLRPLFNSLFPLEDFNLDWVNQVFLGCGPLILILVAFVRSKNRRDLLPWLLLFLPFFVLRLGSFLSVNDIEYRHIVLPKLYLTELFPHLFKPFWATDNFHAGTLLPFAVLTCFGLRALLQAIPDKYRKSTVLLLTAAVAFEYYQVQNPYVMPEERLDFVDWLQQEEDQDSISLINVPFGTGHFKTYGFYQTFNGYPHVAGRPTRTPASAFDYIKSNLILDAWNRAGAAACLPGNREAFIAAQEQLLSDGFTHIILHHYWRNLALEARTLLYLPAAYEDNSVSIYRVRDLHLNCDSAAVLSTSPGNSMVELQGARPILPVNHVSVLGIHSYEMTDGRLFDFYAALDQATANLVPLRAENLVGQRASSPRLPLIDYDSALEANNIVLVAHDPRHTEPSAARDFDEWVSRYFESCGILAESGSAVVKLYLRPDIPCVLAASSEPLGARYDNDIQLSNVVAAKHGTFLELYLLWSHLPEENYSISVQFFDADYKKVYNQDFIIGLEPIAYHRVDLTGLEPGDYQVKLIVYNFETSVSVPGELISSGTRFERELHLTELSVEP